MSEPAPLVSILIPAWNAAQWLPATLASAFAQTWPACEVIVIDDGSTDSSLELAKNLCAGRPAARVLGQPNRGAAAARNHGLREARGAYIQFLDADDLLAPDKIEAQLRLIRESSGTRPRLVSGAWARFSDHPETARFEEQANWRDLDALEFLQLHFETTAMMPPAAWLCEKALLDQAGPWNEALSLNDDGEYFARVMLCEGRIRFCREARSLYRSNLQGSLSKQRSPKALHSLEASIEAITRGMLAKARDPRTLAAAAQAWKWTAFEVYPECPDIARACEARCAELGGSRLPFPAGPAFQRLSKVLGWRLAKRLRNWKLSA